MMIVMAHPLEVLGYNLRVAGALNLTWWAGLVTGRASMRDDGAPRFLAVTQGMIDAEEIEICLDAPSIPARPHLTLVP